MDKLRDLLKTKEEEIGQLKIELDNANTVKKAIEESRFLQMLFSGLKTDYDITNDIVYISPDTYKISLHELALILGKDPRKFPAQLHKDSFFEKHDRTYGNFFVPRQEYITQRLFIVEQEIIDTDDLNSCWTTKEQIYVTSRGLIYFIWRYGFPWESDVTRKPTMTILNNPKLFPTDSGMIQDENDSQ